MADRKRKPPARPNYDPFVRIGKAAGIDLPPLQAAKFLMNHTLFLLAKWAPSRADKKTRALWKTLAKDCRRCSETLRRINGLILRDVGLLFGGRAAEMAVLRPDRSYIQEVSKFLKLDGKGRASKKPPLLPLLEDCSDLIRRLGLWTGFAEDRLEKSPERKSGRRPDYDVKWYIEKLYSIYRASGGKGTAYWNNYSGHFEGPFLNMVAMTLEKTQTPIRSRDALAQTIKSVLSRQKERRPAEN